MSAAQKSMMILAFESSCDDTACAVVAAEASGRYNIVAQCVSSQIQIHQKFGGVVPEVASREHLAQIIPLLDKTLQDAGISLENIDLFAATAGPGLVGSLLVGAQVAKGLAFAQKKPVMGVHHLEGHIAAVCFLDRKIRFPALALLVSGGHTCLIHMDSFTSYRLIGQTRDDAAGEAFDKIGKVLGFNYPAGPMIDKLAQTGHPALGFIKIPKLMNSSDSRFDFSFSGLKTWALQNLGRLSAQYKQEHLADICALVQAAIVEQLYRKAQMAITSSEYHSLILSGGVACNQGLRDALEQLAGQQQVEFFVPPKFLCTDNAAMIACAAHQRYLIGEKDNLDFSVKPYWPLFTSDKSTR